MCVCVYIWVPASIWLQASMAKISLEEREVRAMAAVKALPCRKIGLFVASTLVLLHCVLQESTGTGGLVVLKSLKKMGAGLSFSPLSFPPSHQGVCPNLRTSTTVHHHGWDLAIDDLLFAVKVEHVDG